MRGKENRLKSVVLTAKPVFTAAFAALFAFGVGIGYCRALRFSAASESELRHYFSSFAQIRTQDVLSADVVLQTLVIFLRGPALAFLLGFSSLGIVLLPLLCVSQGFFFSFAFFCCVGAMGRELYIPMLLLFLLRFLTVLPCTLLLSEASIANSCLLASYSFGKGKRLKEARYGTAYFIRFAACCAVLLLGAVLELWLIPRILIALG